MKIRCLPCEFDMKDSAALQMLYKAKVLEMLATPADKTANFGSAHFPFQENCLKLCTLNYFWGGKKKLIIFVCKRKQEIKKTDPPIYKV